ncbi:MAG TPA: glutaredoxin domain-containing protein [Gammaproteobacteria bacterium]|nr:glutaredoxin domain-containing protein [Gammaproteobacteria bacterium]
MKRYLLYAIIAAGLYAWYGHNRVVPQAGSYGRHPDTVIMYSLTTCGHCKAKAQQLHAEGVAFTEYYIDRDKVRRGELNTKLSKAGFPPRRYGTPILDVHGYMLPNNPSMDVIRQYLER